MTPTNGRIDAIRRWQQIASGSLDSQVCEWLKRVANNVVIADSANAHSTGPNKDGSPSRRERAIVYALELRGSYLKDGGPPILNKDAFCIPQEETLRFQKLEDPSLEDASHGDRSANLLYWNRLAHQEGLLRSGRNDDLRCWLYEVAAKLIVADRATNPTRRRAQLVRAAGLKGKKSISYFERQVARSRIEFADFDNSKPKRTSAKTLIATLVTFYKARMSVQAAQRKARKVHAKVEAEELKSRLRQ